MRSLMKNLIAIVGGIGALAGLALFSSSCEESDDHSEKASDYFEKQPAVYGPGPDVDCDTVDPCKFPECSHLCSSGIYGPLNVDCDNVKYPCDFPECSKMCDAAVYGPGPTVDEMLEYCCGKNDASDAYKACKSDYDSKGCEHIPAICYTGDHCNYDQCINAPICTNKESANCDTVENPCSYDECKDSHKCVSSATKDDCDKTDDPCSNPDCKDQCETMKQCKSFDNPCKYAECKKECGLYKSIKECCGDDTASDEYKKCADYFAENNDCPKKE